VGQLDNRGSTFYLALYWAQALAQQETDARLAHRFHAVAAELTRNESRIVAELNGAQGSSQDIGGYYRPDPTRTERAMRPSPTLNAIIDAIAPARQESVSA
jgi:isocitrate dehydrogenase